MNRPFRLTPLPRPIVIAALALCVAATPGIGASTGYTLVGWNNLGMHCMDADYSVFSILPPYNTIHAQLVDPSGRLVTSPGGITVTYEAVPDPAGSINRTSAGKTRFWDFAAVLYGAAGLAVDVGLTGARMPGEWNTPQPMTFDPALDWFIAEGIPITPTDDSSAHNPYPMMRLVARDASGAVIASTDIVLPVSDEMDCRACHASTSGPDARPAGGWVNDPDPQRDYRLNILRRHDETQAGSSRFQEALAAKGYNAAGLETTVITDGTSILCAGCHASNALPGTGLAGIAPLTRATHAFHASVIDPVTHLSMDATANRSACYRCHPGSTTRCLRGVMGRAVAADGSMMMQCQSCHGPLSMVGSAREGWLDEPTCQSCHTGTARHNNGSLRYTSVFTSPGQFRQAVDGAFATSPDAPAPGLSLYRFSRGHGGLACEACHGSTHAEYPSTHVNDNLQSARVQGHDGVLSDCGACHGTTPSTITGGPHGMHPVGAEWIGRHEDAAEHTGSAACADCHGTDFRGTPLSYTLGPRSLSAFGSKTFWKGFQVGCYNCHKGPRSENANGNHAPKVTDAFTTTDPGAAIVVPLQASDADGNSLTLRIVAQPLHGTTALSGRQATYYPEAGYRGADGFTFAAWDGQTNSNLGTVGVEVGAGTAPPSVTGIAKSANPFRLIVTGANYHAGIQVTIAGQGWANVTRTSDMRLVLKGAGLKGLFPANTWVPITLINPADALSVAIEYNRTTGAWRYPGI